MAKIEGRIATRNNTHTIKVCIYNKNCNKPSIHIDASRSVKFADNPVTITQQQDDTFEHILKTQCKIRLVSKQWLGDYLFASNYFSIVVNVWVEDDCVFCGVVKPLSYNQNFAHTWEEIEIIATDLLSTLKDRRLTDIASWDELNAQSQIRPFSWFLGNMDLDTKTVVIPNFPDIDYGEAEMMWTEVDWERIVNPDGSITYYGIEAEIVVLDEETAMNTGELRQGEEKEVTWIESTDTCIVDGVSYYKEYAHITVCGEDVNTGDWRIGSMVNDGMPQIISTRNEVDGWTRGALPQPLEYYEHYTTYSIYDNGMEIPTSDGIGEQIPETPDTTTNGSYYEFRQGAADDFDIDETTGFKYYKNYAWCVVNDEAQNTGDWVRGDPWQYNDLTQYPMYGKSYFTRNDPPTATINGLVCAPDYWNSSNKVFAFENIPTTFTALSLGTPDSMWRELYFNNVDTSAFTNMNSMFKSREYLTLLDASCFDTSNVTDMGEMFIWCSSLKTIHCADWDTSNVTNMYMMFNQCESLTDIDLSNWNTSSVTDMSLMFQLCKRLPTLNVANWDVSSVTNMSGMFNACHELETLDLSNWDVSSVTNMSGMFAMYQGLPSNSKLTNIYLSDWDVSNVTRMEAMFYWCINIRTLDLSKWDVSNVTHMYDMFYHCIRLTSLNISNWNISNDTNIDGLFKECNSLSTLVMNNVSDTVFDMITDTSVTYLRTAVTIYRDNDTYTYNSNTNTWEIQ